MADTHGWLSRGTGYWSPRSYFWSGNDEVVYLRAESSAYKRVVRKRLSPPGVADIDTALRLPVSCVDLQLSPDGRALSWIESRTATTYGSKVAYLDGSMSREVPTLGEHIWGSDNSTLIQFRYKGGEGPARIGLCSFDIRSGLTKTVWADLKKAPSFVSKYAQALGAVPGQLLHSYPDGRVLTGTRMWRRLGAPRADPLSFCYYDSRDPAAPIAQWEVPVPGGDSGLTFVSPDGQRLLWIESDRSVFSQDVIIHKILPVFKIRSRGIMRLLVSDLRGGGMHVIATHDFGEAAPSSPPIVPGDFAWTPDNRRVSFTYNNALYTLKAD